MLLTFFSKLSPHPARFPFFYGWVILLVGTIGFLMSAPGQTIGVSAFTDSLLSVLQLSRDELSLAYMGGTMLSAAMLTRAGKFFDRFGAMRTALIASVGLALALLYLSQIDRITAPATSITSARMLLVLIGFIFIRFFGQGVLSLASRTMIVKWFDDRRGLAIGILSVFAAFGFSIAPMLFDGLITEYDWSGAWIVIALASGVVFPMIILLFFKDAPEQYGLIPDGHRESGDQSSKVVRFPVYRDFTLSEARRTLSLWVFTGFPALFGLFVTGFTFHVVSIFEEQGIGREVAIHIFQPIAIVSVVSSILCSWISDFVRLKYLAYIFAIGALISIYGLIFLKDMSTPYYALIVGYGICSGIHSLVISLFLPRFYGKTHLGAITGQAMTVVVFSSALGPILFSQSLTLTGDYRMAAYVCAIGFILLFIGAFLTGNPQLQYATKTEVI